MLTVSNEDLVVEIDQVSCWKSRPGRGLHAGHISNPYRVRDLGPKAVISELQTGSVSTGKMHATLARANVPCFYRSRRCALLTLISSILLLRSWALTFGLQRRSTSSQDLVRAQQVDSDDRANRDG